MEGMRRPRPLGIALAVAVAAAAIPACALTVDTSGLSGGASGATPSDAAVDAPVSARDGGGPGPDAARDAASEGDATLTRFCAPGHGHALCVDFDDGPAITGFDDQSVGAVGEVVSATERSRSAPRSLRTTLGRREATIEYAVVIHSRSGPWRRVVTDFDIYLETPTFKASDINAGIFTAGFYGDSQDMGIAFSAGPDYTTLAAPGTALSGPVFPFDRWVHVHFDIDPVNGKLSSTVDGVTLERTFFPIASGNSPSSSLSFGVSGYNKPCPTFRAYYDNIVVDYP